MNAYLARFLVAFLFSGSVGMAALIEWGVEFSGATFSDGTPVSDGFVFELGSFSSGFSPTSENLEDWREHFLTSGLEENRIEWENLNNSTFPTFGEKLGSSIFRSGGELEAGDQVFLWGYNSQTYRFDSEWLLLTNPAWQLSAPTAVGDDPASTIVMYATDPGTSMIFGKNFNLAGNEDLMNRAWQTEAVPEPSTYALLFGLAAIGFIIRKRIRS